MITINLFEKKVARTYQPVLGLTRGGYLLFLKDLYL